jgi:flavin-dependent dehydrogenase
VNPHLKETLREDFFESFDFRKVHGTGNLYLGRKSKAENGIIMIGDAAGVISPFTGDGIGMAFDSAKLAAGCLALRKQHKIKHDEISQIYGQLWNKMFNRRIRISKIIQYFLLKPSLQKLASQSIPFLNYFPFLNSYLLKATRA